MLNRWLKRNFGIKMKKIILHEIGNQGNFNYYVFDKKQSVAENLSIVFYRIFEIDWEFWELDTKIPQEKKINITKFTDIHQSLTRKNDLIVDVFYGNKKIYITIICPENLRLKFNEELGKISVMPKPKKIKPKRKIKW